MVTIEGHRGERAGFDGKDIDGKIHFAAGSGGSRSLSAEFERLALGEPLSTGVEMETNPADLPALHLYANSLRYSHYAVGQHSGDCGGCTSASKAATTRY